jgi:hypothetical protein
MYQSPIKPLQMQKLLALSSGSLVMEIQHLRMLPSQFKVRVLIDVLEASVSHRRYKLLILQLDWNVTTNSV